MTTEGLFSASQNNSDARTSLSASPRFQIGWTARFCSALTILILLGGSTSLRAQSNFGIGTTTPNASAILELSSTSKGFLMPRMNTTQKGLISSPVAGLMVFDNALNSFWYFDGTAWQPFSSGWLQNGNAGTVDGVNFLGTTDNIALTLRANNLQALRIEPHTSSPDLIGGYNGNLLTSGVYGSVIGGGGVSGSPNSVTTNFDFIGGGTGNVAGDNGGAASAVRYASVVGGSGNTASGFASSILGGEFHTAGGQFSSIIGGEGNTAYGFSQTVLGQFNDLVPSSPSVSVSNPFTAPALVIGGGTSVSNRYNSLTADFKGILSLGEDGVNATYSATPELRISGGTSGHVGFKAAAATTTHSYTFPAAQGALNTVLSNDGSGNLSWNLVGSSGPQHFSTITLTSMSASVNNLVLDSTKSVFRISSSAIVNITGLADTSDGRYVVLMNVGTNNIAFTNQDALSTASNRVITGSGANLTLTPDRSVALIYDGITTRWRVVGRTP